MQTGIIDKISLSFIQLARFVSLWSPVVIVVHGDIQDKVVE